MFEEISINDLCDFFLFFGLVDLDAQTGNLLPQFLFTFVYFLHHDGKYRCQHVDLIPVAFGDQFFKFDIIIAFTDAFSSGCQGDDRASKYG